MSERTQGTQQGPPEPLPKASPGAAGSRFNPGFGQSFVSKELDGHNQSFLSAKILKFIFELTVNPGR